MKRTLFVFFAFLLAFAKPSLAQYSGYGLQGVYYTNTNLTSAAVTENDPWVSFLWNGCPPQPNMSVSVFSAQWQGQVVPSYSEPYTFTVFVAGGVSLIVNGQVLVSSWTDGANRSAQGSLSLTAGTPVSIVLDYYTDGSNAPVTNTDHLQLAWQSPSQVPETIPREYFLSGMPVVPTPTPQAPLACQPPPGDISVDGVLSEWPWTTPSGWTHFNRTVGGNSYGASANFKTLWDSNDFYIGVTVTDSVLTNNGAAQDYDNSDVEVFLDTNDSKSLTQVSTDYAYFFRWNDTACQEINGRTGGVSMRTTTIPTGYVLEASIPWATLGLQPPNPGQVMGFDVGVDVNHNGGGCRDGQLIWNGGPDDYYNAANYAQLAFAPACPTPVSTPPAPVGGNPYVSPNPTDGGSVKFVYTMAEAGTAGIKVWNAWGNLVATLSDPKGAGEQSSVLDVTSFAPGHYFYRVELDYGSGRSDKFKTQVLAVKK